MKDFSEFERAVGITFNNKDLLTQAFLHRSYINEHRDSKLPHNERLEFLGDAVLELVVTDFLFKRFPDKTEGDLTAYRAALVNTMTLSSVADSLQMDGFLLLSKGEARDTGRARQYILANTYEALVGALYLDQGYKSVGGFIERTVIPLIDNIIKHRLWQDYKSHFQQEAQEKMSITPSYKTLRQEGPDHDKLFIVGVFLDEKKIAEGEGRSKQEAEQVAAENALKKKKW